MSMGTKRKKGYVPRRSWSIFDRETYHWAWVDKKFFGVFDCFRKDLRYCRQRIKKGYCDADLYSIYDWFLEIVPAMLEQYKKTRHGSPGILGENYENEDGILVNDTCYREGLPKITTVLSMQYFGYCTREHPDVTYLPIMGSGAVFIRGLSVGAEKMFEKNRIMDSW